MDGIPRDSAMISSSTVCVCIDRHILFQINEAFLQIIKDYFASSIKVQILFLFLYNC